MNHRRAVHRHGGEIASPHEVNQDGTETALDHVPANPPDDRLALSPRLFNCTYHSAKALPSQYLGQGIQPLANAGARPRDLCEVSNRNLAWPRGERIGADVIEFERLSAVYAHVDRVFSRKSSFTQRRKALQTLSDQKVGNHMGTRLSRSLFTIFGGRRIFFI